MDLGTMNHISSIYGFESERRRDFLLAILFALVGSILASCVPITPAENATPPIFSCSKFDFSHWREFGLGLEPSPDELFTAVSRLYQIDRDQLHIETYLDGEIQRVHWADNNVGYFADFRGGGQLASIEVHWDREKPTLVQVVDCLGPPNIEEERSEKDIANYWADVVVGKSPYPGYVTLLVVEGISSVSAESPLQAIQNEQRVNQLSVFAMLMPQQLIETPEPFPCAKFSVSRWQKFRFGVDSLEDVVATVVRLWGIDEGKISFGETANAEFHFIEWDSATEESHYEALFVGGKQLDRSHVLFLPVPTLGQVIDCLGTPEYYIANGGPRAEATHLQIWYVKQGFVATGHVFHSVLWQKALKAIPPGFGMNSFHVLPAGFEQMARRFGYLDEEGNPVLCDLKPWPDSIEAIVIEENLARCADSDAE